MHSHRMQKPDKLEPQIARIIAVGASVILCRSHPEYGALFFGPVQAIDDIERKEIEPHIP